MCPPTTAFHCCARPQDRLTFRRIICNAASQKVGDGRAHGMLLGEGGVHVSCMKIAVSVSVSVLIHVLSASWLSPFPLPSRLPLTSPLPSSPSFLPSPSPFHPPLPSPFPPPLPSPFPPPPPSHLQRQMYQDLLVSVPMLSNLEVYPSPPRAIRISQASREQ